MPLLKIAIVVLNFNGWDDTHKCLASIGSQTKSPAQVILVDNASKENRCAEIHSDFPAVRLYRNSMNRGFAGGNNDGIKIALEANPDVIFILNNDTIISRDAIELLSAGFNRHPEYGIIGPIINYMDEPEVVRTDGCLFNLPGQAGFFTRKVVPPSETDITVLPTDIVNGCAMAVRRQVFERIGVLDESYFIVHEESDFCLRAARAGFRNGILDRVLVWHKGSSSFQREGKEYQRYYDARNLWRLLQRYHGFNGRPRTKSYLEYFRYVYYRYCHEIESGNPGAALACSEGLVDAIMRRTGPRRSKSRSLASRGIASLFVTLKQLSKTLETSKKTHAHTSI